MKLTLFKKGNAKIHTSCGVTTLPTHICKVQCKGCYAKKPEVRFPAVLTARNNNLELTKRPDYVVTMIQQIKASKVTTFRLHESGDFYSQEYVDNWTEIVSVCKDVKFYTYTKTSFDFSYLTGLNNFNLIESITPHGMNYGSVEYCQSLVTKGYTLCPCIKGSTVVCMKDCTACATKSKVCFIIH